MRKDRNMKFIVFDIETKGLRDEALALAEPFKAYEPLPAFDPKNVKIGNLKDPDKIAAKIRAEEEAYPEKIKQHFADYEKAQAEYEAKIISKAALNALCGEVVAIGIKTSAAETILSGNEADILRRFWEFFGTNPAPLVGWNSNGFDVPFLVRRSWKRGIVVPNVYQGRYLDKRFIDLMENFACGEYGYRLKLDDAAKFFGVEGKYQGDCTGADFAMMFESDDPISKAKAIEYLKCDLRATYAIAERMLNVPPATLAKAGLTLKDEEDW